MDLLNKKCVPCEGGAKPFDKETIAAYLPLLKLPWQVIDDKKMRHEFKFETFIKAITFVNKVAHLAEAEGHHPDIRIYYNKIMIELWTHAIGGLSINDFIVAAKMENLK